MSDRLRRFRRVAVLDVTPLRAAPGFRSLFFGFFFIQGGRQLTVVAVPFQLYQITGSTLAVGLLGLAQLLPLLLLSLIGGALADAIDRRKIVVVAPFVLALTAAGLMWNALAEVPARMAACSCSARSTPVCRPSTARRGKPWCPGWWAGSCSRRRWPSTRP